MSFVPGIPPQKLGVESLSRLGFYIDVHSSGYVFHGFTFTKHLFGNEFAKSPFVRDEYDNVNVAQ